MNNEAELVEALWQKRARETRRLNRRLWIIRVATTILWAMVAIAALVMLIYGVLVAFLDGPPTQH